MPRLRPLFAATASLILLAAVPSPAQAQDFGFCELVAVVGANSPAYSNVFPVPASSAPTNIRQEMLAQQFARAFATDERAGWKPRCNVVEAKYFEEEKGDGKTRARAELELALDLRTWREGGSQVSLVRFQPQPLATLQPQNPKLAGPTEEATVSWLRATLPGMLHGNAPHQLDPGALRIAYRWTEDMRVITEIRVPFSDVRAVSWSRQANGLPRVVLTGTFQTRLVGEPWMARGSELPRTVTVAEMFLRPEAGNAEVDRLVKALKHYASLRGATLVSDDLFQ